MDDPVMKTTQSTLSRLDATNCLVNQERPIGSFMRGYAKYIAACGRSSDLPEEQINAARRATLFMDWFGVPSLGNLDPSWSVWERTGTTARKWHRGAQPAVNALRLLHRSPQAHMNLDDLARAVGCSRSVLTRSVRRYFHCSIHDAHTQMRLERAVQLLTETTYSIDCIARLVGYESTSTLYAMFTRVVGVAPGWVRRNVSCSRVTDASATQGRRPGSEDSFLADVVAVAPLVTPLESAAKLQCQNGAVMELQSNDLQA